VKYYRKRVEYYFESEYSDFTLLQAIEQIRLFKRTTDSNADALVEITVGEMADPEKQAEIRSRWERKISQIIKTYYEADKPPAEAAKKLGSVLGAYTQGHLLD
jgi:hypothetical protein